MEKGIRLTFPGFNDQEKATDYFQDWFCFVQAHTAEPIIELQCFPGESPQDLEKAIKKHLDNIGLYPVIVHIGEN